MNRLGRVHRPRVDTKITAERPGPTSSAGHSRSCRVQLQLQPQLQSLLHSNNMAARKAPTAVAMMNMGGPSSLKEVQFFLTNLFTDPEIIPMGKLQPVVGPWVAKRRTPRISEQYAAIGGGSPILKWTNVQGENMCRILDQIRPEVCVM